MVPGLVATRLTSYCCTLHVAATALLHAVPRCVQRAYDTVADFLAEEDYVTRMLKDWGDTLDRRLPAASSQLLLHPAATAAAAAAAGAHGAHGQQQHVAGPAALQHSAGAVTAAAAQPHMAPADLHSCIVVLRSILMLTPLIGRFIDRFLPHVGGCGAQRSHSTRACQPTVELAVRMGVWLVAWAGACLPGPAVWQHDLAL